eukprot:6213086-Pleurochrysis_carterae.AAC.3
MSIATPARHAEPAAASCERSRTLCGASPVQAGSGLIVMTCLWRAAKTVDRDLRPRSPAEQWQSIKDVAADHTCTRPRGKWRRTTRAEVQSHSPLSLRGERAKEVQGGLSEDRGLINQVNFAHAGDLPRGARAHRP